MYIGWFVAVVTLVLLIEFQAKPKQEEKDASGPRMNDKIRAQFVRLVTDDGVFSFAADSFFFIF